MVLWARKLYRIIFGSIFLMVYYFSSRWLALAVVCFFLLFLLLIEWARHKHPGFWPYLLGETKAKKWYIKITKRIFKAKPGKIMADTWFLLGTAVTFLFFSKSIAICVLLFCVFGDAASAIVGVRWGSIKLIGKKSLQGSLAHLFICLLVGFGLANLPGLTLSPLLILVGAVVASLVELLPIPLDDNLTVPILTAIMMELVR